MRRVVRGTGSQPDRRRLAGAARRNARSEARARLHQVRGPRSTAGGARGLVRSSSLGTAGDRARMARSLDRPMRYFLAKEAAGPMLIVSDRIDSIAERLEAEGLRGPVSPELHAHGARAPRDADRARRLPRPESRSTVGSSTPRSGRLKRPTSIVIGGAYVGALLDEVSAWLDADPVGGADRRAVLRVGSTAVSVLSGGASRAARLAGESPARLKAFTLSTWTAKARRRVDRPATSCVQTGLEMLGETIEVRTLVPSIPLDAVAVIEDYKPLDVECAAVALALLQGVRDRYPDLATFLIDGDGGDENLKDYPIEENRGAHDPERGGQSNAVPRGLGRRRDQALAHLFRADSAEAACAGISRLGSTGSSSVLAAFFDRASIGVSEAIPFRRDDAGVAHAALYDLKGRRGRQRHPSTPRASRCPSFTKRRFQQGAVGERSVAESAVRARAEADYRARFVWRSTIEPRRGPSRTPAAAIAPGRDHASGASKASETDARPAPRHRSPLGSRSAGVQVPRARRAHRVPRRRRMPVHVPVL